MGVCLMIQQAMDGIVDDNQILPVTVLGTLIGKMEILTNELLPSGIHPFFFSALPWER